MRTKPTLTNLTIIHKLVINLYLQSHSKILFLETKIVEILSLETNLVEIATITFRDFIIGD